jgi:hypothetical protein
MDSRPIQSFPRKYDNPELGKTEFGRQWHDGYLLLNWCGTPNLQFIPWQKLPGHFFVP